MWTQPLLIWAALATSRTDQPWSRASTTRFSRRASSWSIKTAVWRAGAEVAAHQACRHRVVLRRGGVLWVLCLGAGVWGGGAVAWAGWCQRGCRVCAGVRWPGLWSEGRRMMEMQQKTGAAAAFVEVTVPDAVARGGGLLAV